MVMFTAEGERRSFSVARDMTVIGRRDDCDLCIPVGDVSRKHCRIVKTEETVRVEDLGSSNGTYVNGQRIQEAALNPGDWVQVGPVQFCVQIDGVPSDDQLAQRTAGAVDETTAGLAVEEPALEESSPAASSVGGMAVEEPVELAESDEAPTSAESADTEDVPLEEVPLEEAPLDEVAADEGAPVDADELEEIVDDAALEEVPEDDQVDLDAPPKQH